MPEEDPIESNVPTSVPPPPTDRTGSSDTVVSHSAQRVISGTSSTITADELVRTIRTATAAVRLLETRIVGQVALANETINIPLTFSRCVFDNVVDLSNANTRSLEFDGSTMHELRAAQVDVRGDLSLAHCHIEGAANIRAARIDGTLNLVDAHLRAPGAIALQASNLSAQRVTARGLNVQGESSFAHSRIAADLDLTSASLSNTGARAFYGQNAIIDGSLLLRGDEPNGGRRFVCTGLIQLIGAKIGSKLDCSGADLMAPAEIALNADSLVARHVDFTSATKVVGELRFVRAIVSADMDFSGAWLENPKRHTLQADHASIGRLLLQSHVNRISGIRNDFVSQGDISLFAAKIHGNLACQGATLSHTSGTSLNGEKLEVAGAVLLRGLRLDFSNIPFVAEGTVRLFEATIGTSLDCQGAQIGNAVGDAIFAEGLNVGGPVLLRTLLAGPSDEHICFEARGRVSLYFAKIGGNLDCQGGEFSSSKDITLDFRRVEVGGSILFRPRTAGSSDNPVRAQVKGGLSLFAARIGDALVCTDASFLHPEGISVDASEATMRVAQMSDGFYSSGEVRLNGAQIAGMASFRGATLVKPGGYALFLDRVQIGTSLVMSHHMREGRILHPFMAEGMVRVLGAKIGLNVESDGKFDGASTSEPTFQLEACSVGMNVLLRNGFAVFGQTRLFKLEVGGTLDLTGATIDAQGRQALVVYGTKVDGDLTAMRMRAVGNVSLQNIRVGGTLNLQGAQLSRASLDLRGASVGRIVDDVSCWPPTGQLNLDGLTYGTLGPLSDATSRLDWLSRQGDTFYPQPYEQLVRVMRQMGHERDARAVAMSKLNIRRRRGGLRWPAVSVAWIHWLTLGYGYQPWRAVAGLGIFMSVGSVVFGWASHEHLMSYIQSTECTAVHGFASAPTNISPSLSPIEFSGDALLPAVQLQQKKCWAPRQTSLSGRLVLYYLAIHTIAGYVLTALALAGFSGLIKKE